MIRAVLFLVALAVAVPAGARAQADNSTVSEFEVAGIPVIFKPIQANEVVAVRLYLDGGSANLTPETAGIERFVAAAAVRGTEKYTRDEFAALSAATGTAIGADCARNVPDFVHQHMRHQRRQSDIAAVDPFIENGTLSLIHI